MIVNVEEQRLPPTITKNKEEKFGYLRFMSMTVGLLLIMIWMLMKKDPKTKAR